MVSASFSVNLDPQVFALIHESKCLLRLNIEIPESAKLVMLQEEKLKVLLPFVVPDFPVGTVVSVVVAMCLRGAATTQSAPPLV